ncbi:hypothetical protein ASE75_01165 [Sphingomonas sp. Leaf17]|uniref:helix-turn-helix domain-containing protein n=1 Tax=Sphingomonas sp. Leaf17 TaxID=1735683 RepID=UPI0006FA2BC6|nr:helix-turn-helix domain-containing protein [Sphingomonas sp. Leaf17]KQM67575.1 hypothetical protein ASE75_01165 [Sphingomonas sp. Leaf17]
MTGPDATIFRFDSATLPEDERFDRYRDLYANGSDAIRLGPDFAARVTAWASDRVTIYERDLHDVGHVRGAERAGQDGFDHLLLTLVADGAVEVDTGRGFAPVPAGSGVILDMQRPMRNRTRFARSYNIRIARDDFLATIGPVRNLHGTILSADGTALLIDYVALLLRRMDALNPPARRSAIDALFLLVAGALGAVTGAVERPATARDAMRLSRIRALIDAHIADPALGPDMIVQRADLSRATLYRLFKPYGGLTSHIQTRRLQLLLLALNDEAETRPFGELALDAGFRSEAHASRLFQKRYGIRPGQYRIERAAQGSTPVPLRAMQFLDDTMR